MHQQLGAHVLLFPFAPLALPSTLHHVAHPVLCLPLVPLLCLCPPARAEKARALFPRPTAGPLRPVVRGQTIKYNSKQKLGRGFSLEELKVRFCGSTGRGVPGVCSLDRCDFTLGRGEISRCGLRYLRARLGYH
jgi:hypothetical protein